MSTNSFTPPSQKSRARPAVVCSAVGSLSARRRKRARSRKVDFPGETSLRSRKASRKGQTYAGSTSNHKCMIAVGAGRYSKFLGFLVLRSDENLFAPGGPATVQDLGLGHYIAVEGHDFGEDKRVVDRVEASLNFLRRIQIIQVGTPSRIKQVLPIWILKVSEMICSRGVPVGMGRCRSKDNKY